MGDSYRFYLWDNSVIQHQHIKALKIKNYELITKLLENNNSTLPDIVPIGSDMGINDDNNTFLKVVAN